MGIRLKLFRIWCIFMLGKGVFWNNTYGEIIIYRIRIAIAILLGYIGSWLMLWDIIDYLTQGFNEGIWNFKIIQDGFLSIFIGFIMILIAVWLGWKGLKG